MKKLKIMGIVLIVIVISYVLYIGIELIRFNNYLGIHPLINVRNGDIYVDVYTDKESNSCTEKYYGIGYTIEYEYYIDREENSDVQLQRLISGEFKLFGKFVLGAWIE